MASMMKAYHDKHPKKYDEDSVNTKFDQVMDLISTQQIEVYKEIIKELKTK